MLLIFTLQGRRKLFLVGGGGGAEIEIWRPESSAAGARLYRGNFSLESLKMQLHWTLKRHSI